MRDVSKNLTQFVSNLLHECKLFCMVAKHKYVCIKKRQLRERRRERPTCAARGHEMKTLIPEDSARMGTKVTHLTSTSNRFCLQIHPDTKKSARILRKGVMRVRWTKFSSHLRNDAYNDREGPALRYFEFSTHSLESPKTHVLKLPLKILSRHPKRERR